MRLNRLSGAVAAGAMLVCCAPSGASADLYIKGCWQEADACTAGTGAVDDTARFPNKIWKMGETIFGGRDGFTLPGSHLTNDNSQSAFHKKTFTATGTDTQTFHDKDMPNDPAPNDVMAATPGPIAGAGPAGLVFAAGALLVLSQWRRKRKAVAA